MKAVIQRVLRAEVRVAGEVVGRCAGPGMVILLGVLRGDDAGCARRLARRIAHFRFFADGRGRMGRAAVEAGAAALVVSQFTLAADGKKGRRPSFDAAAPAAEAEALYRAFVRDLAAEGLAVETGRFGAMMEVELVGDGPVTFVLEEPGGGRSAPGPRSQVLA